VTNLRTIVRNTSVQAGADMLGKVASLAFFVVMARELGQEGFGAFIFALSLALLTTAVAGFGFEDLIGRDVSREPAVAPRLMTDALLARAVSGLLAVAVAVAIAWVGGSDADVRLVVALLALAAALETTSKVFHATFQGLDDLRPVAAALILQRIFTAVVGVSLLLAGQGVVTMALVYLAGAVLAQAYVALRLVRRGVRPERRPSVARSATLVRASAALGITVVLDTVLFRIDATMLSFMKTDEDVGIYGAAYRLLESTLFLSWAFVAALLPTLSRLSATTSPSVGDVYELGTKLIVTALLPLGTGFALFAGPVVDLLYGAQYEEAVSAVRLLGGAAALYGIAFLSASTLIAQRRQAVLPWATGAVLVVNVTLNLVLIPPLSYDGAALATSISQLLIAVVLSVAVWRVTGPLSLGRVLAGPVAGSAAMAAVAAVAGASLPTLALGAAAYALVLLVVERRLFPADVRLLLGVVRRQRPVSDASG
jgi:O-antigen/teichoic acid export membrane protein